MKITLHCFSVCMLLSFHLNGQSTLEYFSIPGLSLNAYHFNFFDGTYSTSFTFFDTATVCGQQALKYVSNNQDRMDQYLVIEDKKVYLLHEGNCEKTLLYDFGLEVGDTIIEGVYEGYVLMAKSDVTLLNGDPRKMYSLLRPSGGETSWIEGLGDVMFGLVPIFGDFEGYDRFVCAKSGDTILWQDIQELQNCDLYSCLVPRVSVNVEIQGFKVRFINETLFANSYSWDFGDTQTSGAVNPTHEYDSAGCYQVKLTILNDCIQESIEQVLNIPICIGEPWKTNYTVDTFFNLSVYRFSDSLEFIYYRTNLYKTTIDGLTWVKLEIPQAPAGVDRFIYAMEMFDELRGIILCGHYGAQSDQKAILVTNDGGLTWEEKVPGSYFMLRVEAEPSGRAWAVGQWEYFRSFDFGNSWEQIDYTGGFQLYNFQFMHDSLLIGRSFTGLQPNGTYHLVKSRDNGLTWEKINLPIFVRSWHFFDSLHGYGFRAGYGMSVTSDGGINWEQIPLPFEVREFSFFDQDHGWLIDENELVHYTADGMKTFTISNCGKEPLRRITAYSPTQSYAIGGEPLGSSATGKTKKTFDESTIVNCTTDDVDEDGYLWPDDCNDENEDVNPGEAETVYNGIDDDCDPETPDDDIDMDGFGLADDCNDGSAEIFPGAIEFPDNGVDEDCDGNDLITGIIEVNLSGITLYPNPTSGLITLRGKNNTDYSLKVFDKTGTLISTQYEINSTIDISLLIQGLYIFELTHNSDGQRSVHKIMVIK